jgi:hypothetical protein
MAAVVTVPSELEALLFVEEVRASRTPTPGFETSNCNTCRAGDCRM